MTDSEERLRHWMRNYGATSQRPFVADLEAVLEELQRLRVVGAWMANLCSNLSQPSWDLTDYDRRTMDELFRAWDAVRRADA